VFKVTLCSQCLLCVRCCSSTYRYTYVHISFCLSIIYPIYHLSVYHLFYLLSICYLSTCLSSIYSIYLSIYLFRIPYPKYLEPRVFQRFQTFWILKSLNVHNELSWGWSKHGIHLCFIYNLYAQPKGNLHNILNNFVHDSFNGIFNF
jgi:hypothetical protein